MVNEEKVIMTIDAVALNLCTAQSQSGCELTFQTRLGRHRNFPDAEEAQHMIDTVGIEELRHLTEATYPPLATVLQHLVPVIGWEAPVLTIGREWIGRCTSLTVEVEVLWFYPSLYTVARDTNGDITLQDDTMVAGIFMGSMHLLVEVILYEVPEVLTR